ncbi:hypothetical protein [Streptomyces sp. NPDC002402]
MAERLTFVLDGRDDLSRVLGHAGDSATRLRSTMTDAADGSNQAILTLTRDADGRLRDLQGQFVSTADAARLMALRTGDARRPMADWAAVADRGREAGEKLKASLISLAPAAIPAAAALAPLVASTAAAGVAVGVYAAALGPQMAAMSEASEAGKKYADAVDKSGRSSKEAVQAHEEYRQAMAKLPPETRRAAAGLSVLKDQYKAWSDGLAKDTMGPVVKGMAIFGGLLPKLTPLVKGTSAELDRFMTLVGGGIASPALDRLIGKFTEFSTGVLGRANDGLVRFLRKLDTGKVGGGLSEFMDYARANGPVLASALRSVGEALTNVLRAGADVGVGMLQAVSALAKLVAAVPAGALTALFQLAVALKLVKLAMAGMAAGRAALVAFTAQIMMMRTAAGGASGGLARMTAAFGAMSRGVKVAVAGTGIGLLLIALSELSQMGKRAPADMDRMTTTLGKFAQTGKLSGEAARILGSNFKEFDEALRGMARPGQWDQIQQGITSFVGMDSTPVKRWKGVLDDVDKSLANMVKSGNTKLAAEAFDQLAARAKSQGMTTAELRTQLGDYRSALADQAFEQSLAAQSMGLFGAQAQATSAKLAAQKQSADGLRQAIQALNDVQRAGLGGMIGFEAAVDAAAKAAKDNAGSLKMVHGQLDLNSEKSRNAASALSDLAAKTDEAAAASRESTGSWAGATAIYERGRAKLIETAQAMGLTKAQAAALARQILQTPNKTAMLKGDLTDLQGKLADAKKRLASVPDSRKAAVRAEISQLNAAIAAARRKLDALDGKTATTYITTSYKVVGKPAGHAGPGGFPKYADGGRPKAGWALVGEEGPELVRFKGGEQVYDHRTSMRMAGAGMDAGRGLAAGLVGSVSGVEASARAMAAAVVAGVRAELQIASPSKRMKAIAADIGKGLIIGLTGSRAKIAATAKDLAGDIAAAFKGVKSKTDDRMIAMVNRNTAKLQGLAAKRDALQARISEAYKFKGELTASARQGAELGSLGLQPEEVNAGSIKAGLAGKLSQIKTFTHYVGMLAKKGLNKTLLRQILNMGPEAGYAYASALATADRTTFSAVNSLQTQLDKSTAALGAAGADAMYDSGKNAGKGFLRGLIDQQKAIEAQMLKIAKGMQAAIKKALGIKSPSTVMAELGRYSTEGLAVGLMQRLPVLDSALGAVTGRIASARPVIGQPVGAGRSGAGSGTVVHLHLTIQAGPASDPQAIWRETRKGLLQLKRDMGGADLGLA